MIKQTIAVIGGGYTGLTAAYRLAAKGYEVTVIEREDRVGGLAAGFELDALPLEKIWHFLYKSDREALALADELGVADRIRFHDSSVSIYYGGHIYPFMSPLDLLRFTPLSLIDRIRTGVVGLLLQRIQNWQPLTKITAYEWMLRRAGRSATRIIWEPLLRGKFGAFFDQVTMSWLWGRIKVRADSAEKGAEKLGYIDGGFSVLTDRLAEAVRRSGGTIRTGVSVRRLSGNADHTVRVTTDAGTETYDRVIATVPTPVFADLIDPAAEGAEAYVRALRTIDYVGAIVMVFTSDQKISPYYWHNINDPEIPFLVFLSNTVLAGERTYAGKNVYYVGCYAAHDHRFFSATEAQVMEEWEAGMKRVFLDFDASKIREKRLFRFKNAQHIVDIGYEDKIPAYESVIPHLYLGNFSQIYPEDRGLNFAIREGNTLAALVDDTLAR